MTLDHVSVTIKTYTNQPEPQHKKDEIFTPADNGCKDKNPWIGLI